jgi:hypothetical protein
MRKKADSKLFFADGTLGRGNGFRRGALILVALLAAVLLPGTDAGAQGSAVQDITGHIEMGSVTVYRLPDLQAGRTLYARVQGISGNLDPFLVLVRPGIDLAALQKAFRTELEKTIAGGGDPLVMIPEFARKHGITWDDDSAKGYAAELKYPIPVNGTYYLIVRSAFARQTFGDYRLLVGIDEPSVLTGKARPRGVSIARLDRGATTAEAEVQEVSVRITADKPSTFIFLDNTRAGQTLTVFMAGTPGSPVPRFTLHDYGDKPLVNSHPGEKPDTAVLQYTFPSDTENYVLRVSGRLPDGSIAEGDFRLLAGIDAPQVLTGKAEPTGRRILREPTEARVGVRLQQITGVDQKAENYGVVATIQIRWRDPALAFSPDTCMCPFKAFRGDDFVRYTTENHIRWPDFTLFNQQGNRWAQNRYVVVFPSGDALYLERFSATLQAPDFDFRRFPFDTQQFFIRVDCLYPEEFYTFADLAGFSEVGKQLGEEEWIVTKFDTSIESDKSSTLQPVSRFNFRFEARRHLTYYMFRIFLPLLVIIAVSWVIFFLKDYAKRVDVSSANLLIFVAFNFTISGDLPRLGYLTFMDSLIVSGYVVTSLVLIFNVLLRRMELTGKMLWAEKIDRYMLWIYPSFYVAAVWIVTLLFT